SSGGEAKAFNNEPCFGSPGRTRRRGRDRRTRESEFDLQTFDGRNRPETKRRSGQAANPGNLWEGCYCRRSGSLTFPVPFGSIFSLAADRQISLNDLRRLQDWTKSGPVAPDGEWYKDFGSFYLCGDGQYTKTVLTKGMRPFGRPID